MTPLEEGTEIFPYRGSERERLRFLLRYALLAPSTHNTQPWLFELSDDGIEVYADSSRWLTRIDPAGRELTMSIGAAVAHLELAMRCHLMEPSIEWLPDPQSPQLMARISCQGEASPLPEELRIFAQAGRRHTVRGEFESRPIRPMELDMIVAQTNVGDCQFHVLSEESRERLGEMVHLGD